jgi:DNA-binding transcriptional MerR regulator
MALNKYHDVGVSLGTIADYIREKGASPVERDYHAVFIRMLHILETQAMTLDEAKVKIDKLEDQVRELQKK